MKDKLLIIGAGCHGRVVADLAKATGKYKEIAFLDDAKIKDFKYPILGNVSYASEVSDSYEIIVAIGNNDIRKKIMNKLDVKFATLIHPNAIIGSDVSIGSGTVIMPGVIINTEAKIGAGVILNTAASVDHDCTVGDFSHVAVGAHLCGTVCMGEKNWIGAGATVLNNIDICDECMIGAGAVVVKNIEESGTYLGIPARRVK